MKAKFEAFLNGLWTGFTDIILGFIGLVKSLITTPKLLIVILLLAGLTYDLISGGKLGGISFIVGKLKEIVEFTKDVTWPQVTTLGVVAGLSYLVFDKIKK